MIEKDFIRYASPWIDEEDRQAIQNAIDDSIITRGPKVELFEEALATYCGARWAVVFNSGSSALAAAYHVLDTGPFDRIISTPNSFIASIGPGVQKLATLSFVDIDPQTKNLDLKQLEEALDRPTSRGKTIVVPVHFAGIPVNMCELEKLLKGLNTYIIEDAAHALGSYYPNRKKVGCCEYSTLTVFSFHPAKTITTGEGGAVTTNDKELYLRLKRFRDNGIDRFAGNSEDPSFYEVLELTGNFHLTEFQAALGLSQLKKIEAFVEKRRQLHVCYQQELSGIEGIHLLVSPTHETTAYHLCVVEIDFGHFKKSKQEIAAKLREKGIGTQVHYIPLYRHPVLQRKLGNISPHFPCMEQYYKNALTLPLFPKLEEEQIRKICFSLKEALKA